jgi:glycosyltransferase involved in cell wall biosynthesis
VYSELRNKLKGMSFYVQRIAGKPLLVHSRIHTNSRSGKLDVPKLTVDPETDIPRPPAESCVGTGICIVVENMPVPLDRRVWQEARALRQAGYRVSVICPKGPRCESSRDSLEGIEIYRHRVWHAQGHIGYLFEYVCALLSELYLALKIYRHERFRVLQACNPPDNIFLIALLLKPFGVRFVFDHHDLAPELYQVKFSRHGLNYRIVRLAERLTFRAADLSIATNESYREIAIARGKMKPEQVVVVQTCADLNEVSGTQPKPELKRGKRHLVVYVGVMEMQDGVQLLIESIEYLVKQRGREDTHFVLIGHGSQVPRLKTMARQSRLEDFVEFTGLLPHERVYSYLSTADVCVAPDPLNALNDKSTMIKTLEYMAFGKPVVLYDLKEGRRTLGNGALYARPNDPIDFAGKIEALLESDSLRRALGEHGRKRIEEQLNWRVQSAKFVGAFARLLSDDTGV